MQAPCLPPSLTRARKARFRYSVYLLYWYKRTNTDAAHPHPPQKGVRAVVAAQKLARYSMYLLYFLALLVQKYKNCRREARFRSA